MKKPVLVMDFDGVIADSQMETLVVGFNSYLRLNRKTKLFDGKKITFTNFSTIKSKYKKIINEYKKLRPFGIDNFCLYVFLTIIENKIKIKNQNDYLRHREKLMQKNYKKYLGYFTKERISIQKKDFDKWVELDKPIDIVINGIKGLEKKYTIAIATMNRREGIKKFLEKYKIDYKAIADPKISADKKKQLKYIVNELKAAYNDVHFVDDQPKHFPKLLNLGITCYLALWGYNNKEQQKKAKKQGAILLKQNDFYNYFNKLDQIED